jgi:hypothetical protein
MRIVREGGIKHLLLVRMLIMMSSVLMFVLDGMIRKVIGIIARTFLIVRGGTG